ncbi:MAG: leucyl aminopeptidase [Candidatus Lokiarchaeota archaeon]|nr:leucyl aminopeptidase [Candidatus Lokiarchaeota archaeon]
MKITFKNKSILELESDIILIFLDESLELSDIINQINESTNKSISLIIEQKDFKGKVNETFLISTSNPNFKRLLLIGIGRKKDANLETLRNSAAAAIKKIKKLEKKSCTLLIEEDIIDNNTYENVVAAITEGAILGNYKYIKLKTEELDKYYFIEELIYPKIPQSVQKAIKDINIVCNATIFVRDLVNEPANIATPTRMANAAEEIAKELNLTSKIYDEEELEKMGFGSFLSVARGSNEPCKFITIEYIPEKKSLKTIAFVGKSITMDTGGISLKPSNGMWEMKQDMHGGATVIGIIKAAAELKLPFHIITLTPATENMPGGPKPNKPGDVIKSYSGKTIEILNTDAEGRLILADALAYASKYKPDIVIDFATLTGACRVALGSFASGIFSDDDELVDQLIKAGEETHERLWRLPLWKEYGDVMKSDIADVRNLNPTRIGGASSAAAFLKFFTTKDYKWAHIDIAPTDHAENDKGYISKGATGVGVRLGIQFLRNFIKK